MSVFEDTYPRENGPFEIGTKFIRETMDRTDPSMIVTLDFGAFRRVWEIVEEAAKTHYPAHDALSTARAELRAVEAFREVWVSFAGGPADPSANGEAPPRRQFKRINARQDPERRKLRRVSG